MVYVDCVRKPIGGYVNATGYVVLPLSWIIAHRQMGNLRITEPAADVLSSKKFSVRILGEVLAALEASDWPEWTKYPFLLINPKSKQVIGLDCTGLGSVSFQVGDRQTSVAVQPYARYLKGENTRPFLSGILETEYNQLMKKVFGCKFPIHLETMHPVQKDIQFKGVPEIGSTEPKVAEVKTRATGVKPVVQTEAKVEIDNHDPYQVILRYRGQEYCIRSIELMLPSGQYPEQISHEPKLKEAYDQIRLTF